MLETIGDIRKRYVWKPLLDSYSVPHAMVTDPVLQAYINGLNDCITILKAVGKI